jgi:hypothetical protein
MNTKLKFLIGIIFCVTIWEHVATQQECAYKPTAFVSTTTIHARTFFKRFGELFGVFSSFLEHIKSLLEYIKLDEYFKSVSNLAWSIIDLAMSWVWVGFGYAEYVCNLSQFSRTLTVIGSSAIALVMAVVLYIYANRYFRFDRMSKNTETILSISVGLVGILTMSYVAAYYNNVDVKEYLMNIHRNIKGQY